MIFLPHFKMWGRKITNKWNGQRRKCGDEENETNFSIANCWVFMNNALFWKNLSRSWKKTSNFEKKSWYHKDKVSPSKIRWRFFENFLDLQVFCTASRISIENLVSEKQFLRTLKKTYFTSAIFRSTIRNFWCSVQCNSFLENRKKNVEKSSGQNPDLCNVHKNLDLFFWNLIKFWDIELLYCSYYKAFSEF